MQPRAEAIQVHATGIQNSGNDCWISAPTQGLFWSVGEGEVSQLMATGKSHTR